MSDNNPGQSAYAPNIRVLAVSTVPGTLARFVSPIAQELESHGFLHSAATGPTDGQDLSAFEEIHQIDWTRNVLDPSNLVRAVRQIRDVLHENPRLDVVHVHTPIAAFVTRFALRKTSTPVVYTAHGFHFYEGGAYSKNLVFRTLERIASRWTTHLITINSEDEAAAARYRLAGSRGMTNMGGVGIDLSEFPRRTEETHRAAKAQLAQSLGIEPDAYVALMVARIDANKRQLDAIQAIYDANNNSFPAHLVLAGTGSVEDEQKCHHLVESLDIADKVHFLGYRSDVLELLTAADVFLLISDREGLPRSIMEALAVGTKVIATDIRGSSDLLHHDAGLLIPTRQPQRLAQALIESQTFEPDAKSIEQVLARCATERIAAQHLAIYRGLVS